MSSKLFCCLQAHVCRHLQSEAKGCDHLVLWLDCDREGIALNPAWCWIYFKIQAKSCHSNVSCLDSRWSSGGLLIALWYTVGQLHMQWQRLLVCNIEVVLVLKTCKIFKIIVLVLPKKIWLSQLHALSPSAGAHQPYLYVNCMEQAHLHMLLIFFTKIQWCGSQISYIKWRVGHFSITGNGQNLVFN